MGSDEAIILYDRVVPYVITAPQYNVVANFDKRLNRIVFEDKAMFAKLHVVPDKSSTADVTSWTVSLRFCSLIQTGA